MMFFRVSVELSVEPLIATQFSTPSTLEQLPVHSYWAYPT